MGQKIARQTISNQPAACKRIEYGITARCIHFPCTKNALQRDIAKWDIIIINQRAALTAQK